MNDGNFVMFPKTTECELKCEISSLIVEHLTLIRVKIYHYFPNIDIKDYDWIRKKNASEIHFFQIQQLLILTFHLLKKKNWPK